MVLLQRLPGLGVDHGEAETRRFVDEAFAEACRAGDMVAFIENPYDVTAFAAGVECAAGSLGVSIGARRVRSRGFSSGKLTAAMERAGLVGYNYLAADVAAITTEADLEVGSHQYIKDVLIHDMEFSAGMPDASRVHYQECLFGLLGIDPEVEGTRLPRFSRCFVGVLEGRVSREDLPAGVFEDCDIEAFSMEAGTTNQVLDLPVPLGVRVLLTVLKKLFERKGRGRRENAMYRGLDYRARRLVPDVLQLLKSHGVACPVRMGTYTVWMPDRSARPRAGRILASPSTKDDDLVLAASRLE
jgi:hypothetical protein